jgi:hypothetical protein
MAKSKIKHKRAPKSVLKPHDLAQSKSAVLKLEIGWDSLAFGQ